MYYLLYLVLVPWSVKTFLHYFENDGYGRLRFCGKILTGLYFAFALFFLIFPIIMGVPFVKIAIFYGCSVLGFISFSIIEKKFNPNKRDKKELSVVVCPSCGQKIHPIHNKTNFYLHIFYMLSTFGLWFFVYVGLIEYAKNEWMCPECNAITKTDSTS